MKLKHKLPLILFLAFVAVILLTFTVSLTNSAKAARASQDEMSRSMADVRSEEVKGFLEKKITELRALEKNIEAMAHLNDTTKAKILGKMLYAISDQPVVSDAYVTFERGTYFSADKTEEGKYYSIEAFLSESWKREITVTPDDVVEDDDEWYLGPKKTRRIHIAEPYEWTYPGEKRPRKMFTLSAPVMVNGKFIGVAGIDLQLDLLQKYLFDKMIDEKKGAYAVLVSNDGLIATHPKEELTLGDIGESMEAAEGQALKEAIKNGKYIRVFKKSLNTGDFSIVSYVPMLPNGLDSPWSLAYAVSLDVVQADAKRTRNNMIMLGIFCTVAWGVFLVLFTSTIFGRITRTVAALGRMTMGDGDLSIRLDERGDDEFGQMARGLNRLMEKLSSMINTLNKMTAGDGDLTVRFEENAEGEFGRMARGLNGLMDKLHSTVKTAQTEAKILLNTSTTLFELSKVLSQSSETTLNESKRVSKESEETSENVHSIASEAERSSANATMLLATAEQVGLNMDSVIYAAGDMSDSFNKINDDTLESKTVAGKAIDSAAAAVKVMDALKASVEEIGRFTNVIKIIAKKTNLLALNAAVEAARAGEVGKGFAVVASEVKQLANQSTLNANDITLRIENIQNGTADAINVIRKISDVITKMNESANSISESVVRQIQVSYGMTETAKQTNVGTQHLIKSIGEVAASIETSAKHATAAADGAKNVSDSIVVIQGDAEKTNAHSTELKDAANSLRNTAEELDSIVCKFKT